MNNLILAGHLGADPEVRFTSNGQKVTTLRVAAKVRRGKTDDTIWWRATVWGENFDKMISYLKKGSAVMVFGEMAKPEIFTDKEGKPQISMNMTANNIMFSPFGRTDKPVGESTMNQNFQKSQPAAAAVSNDKVEKGAKNFDMNDFPDDDEVPF